MAESNPNDAQQNGAETEIDGLADKLNLLGEVKTLMPHSGSGSAVDPPEEEETNPFLGENFDADEYDFTHRKRGTAVIICNCKFDSEKPRNEEYSKRDVVRLQETLTQLGFAVKEYWNCSTTKMLKILEDVAAEDHSDDDCFLCAISSHGYWDEVTRPGHSVEIGDVVFGTDGFLSLYQLFEKVYQENCGTLGGKPKIFLFQACRGSMLQSKVETKALENSGRVIGAEVVTHKGSHIHVLNDTNTPFQSSVPYNIPLSKDFLLAYSTPPGFFSYNTSKGSPFMQCLCSRLESEATSEDFLSILTEVCGIMATDFESYMPSLAEKGVHERKQMPWVASMLSKDIYFRSKEQTTEQHRGGGDAAQEIVP